jgi:hypothetical protein
MGSNPAFSAVRAVLRQCSCGNTRRLCQNSHRAYNPEIWKFRKVRHMKVSSAEFQNQSAPGYVRP